MTSMLLVEAVSPVFGVQKKVTEGCVFCCETLCKASIISDGLFQKAIHGVGVG